MSEPVTLRRSSREHRPLPAPVQPAQAPAPAPAKSKKRSVSQAQKTDKPESVYEFKKNELHILVGILDSFHDFVDTRGAKNKKGASDDDNSGAVSKKAKQNGVARKKTGTGCEGVEDYIDSISAIIEKQDFSDLSSVIVNSFKVAKCIRDKQEFVLQVEGAEPILINDKYYTEKISDYGLRDKAQTYERRCMVVYKALDPNIPLFNNYSATIHSDFGDDVYNIKLMSLSFNEFDSILLRDCLMKLFGKQKIALQMDYAQTLPYHSNFLRAHRFDSIKPLLKPLKQNPMSPLFRNIEREIQDSHTKLAKYQRDIAEIRAALQNPEIITMDFFNQKMLGKQLKKSFATGDFIGTIVDADTIGGLIHVWIVYEDSDLEQLDITQLLDRLNTPGALPNQPIPPNPTVIPLGLEQKRNEALRKANDLDITQRFFVENILGQYVYKNFENQNYLGKVVDLAVCNNTNKPIFVVQWEDVEVRGRYDFFYLQEIQLHFINKALYNKIYAVSVENRQLDANLPAPAIPISMTSLLNLTSSMTRCTEIANNELKLDKPVIAIETLATRIDPSRDLASLTEVFLLDVDNPVSMEKIGIMPFNAKFTATLGFKSDIPMTDNKGHTALIMSNTLTLKFNYMTNDISTTLDLTDTLGNDPNKVALDTVLHMEHLCKILQHYGPVDGDQNLQTLFKKPNKVITFLDEVKSALKIVTSTEIKKALWACLVLNIKRILDYGMVFMTQQFQHKKSSVYLNLVPDINDPSSADVNNNPYQFIFVSSDQLCFMRAVFDKVPAMYVEQVNNSNSSAFDVYIYRPQQAFRGGRSRKKMTMKGGMMSGDEKKTFLEKTLLCLGESIHTNMSLQDNEVKLSNKLKALKKTFSAPNPSSTHYYTNLHANIIEPLVYSFAIQLLDAGLQWSNATDANELTFAIDNIQYLSCLLNENKTNVDMTRWKSIFGKSFNMPILPQLELLDTYSEGNKAFLLNEIIKGSEMHFIDVLPCNNTKVLFQCEEFITSFSNRLSNATTGPLKDKIEINFSWFSYRDLLDPFEEVDVSSINNDNNLRVREVLKNIQDCCAQSLYISPEMKILDLASVIDNYNELYGKKYEEPYHFYNAQNLLMAKVRNWLASLYAAWPQQFNGKFLVSSATELLAVLVKYFNIPLDRIHYAVQQQFLKEYHMNLQSKLPESFNALVFNTRFISGGGKENDDVPEDPVPENPANNNANAAYTEPLEQEQSTISITPVQRHVLSILLDLGCVVEYSQVNFQTNDAFKDFVNNALNKIQLPSGYNDETPFTRSNNTLYYLISSRNAYIQRARSYINLFLQNFSDDPEMSSGGDAANKALKSIVASFSKQKSRDLKLPRETRQTLKRDVEKASKALMRLHLNKKKE